MTAKEKNDYLCKTAAADLFEIKPAQPLPEKRGFSKALPVNAAANKRQSITQEMKTERLYVWIVFIRTIVFC